MRIDIDRLIGIDLSWVKFNLLKPFRVFCYDQSPYKLPTQLLDPKIKGYFILAGQNSFLYLFDIEEESYCFLDNLPPSVEDQIRCTASGHFYSSNGTNVFKIKNSNVALTNNYFCINGHLYQEIIKISAF